MREDDLPQTWLPTKLGAVVDYGKTRKAEPEEIDADAWILELEDIEKNTSRILSKQNFQERQSKSTKNKFAVGDVLYGKLRPYLNKVVIADQAGYCTTEIVPVDGKPFLDNRYLFYWLKHPTFLNYVETESHGLNMPRLGTETGKAAPFVLAPLVEQKRIADKLDTLLEQVDACRTRLDNIPRMMKRFRQAVLTSATSGKLTEDFRAGMHQLPAKFNIWQKTLVERQSASQSKRLKEPVRLINTPIENLPASWIWASIDESSLKITDGTHHSPENFSSGDFKYVTSKNVREGYIELKGITFVSKEVHDEIYSRCDVQKNDVLFVKDGANTGLACVSPFEEQISLLSSVGVIRCSSFLQPKFLELVLNSPETRKRMLSEMSGNAIPRLTLTKIASSAIPIPPLAEQSEIIRRVETLFAFADRLEARYSAARAQVEQLTPALLAKAFRGELVEQDPQDEPASSLLARIAAARPVPTAKRKKP